ncbi:MAG: hypothetical protein A3G34_17445 [Candidatus Lindowbacteria bacterium RIFCSPLOWO2_12_FULL_62_27]|nr:MAG: hypothetical protein A3G34_17445 [Candidatus Lindowbacteria bacterium RIFCSPLOWO2_12_FULL_62_27]OGH62174.1 MAG: hypothetical protein A3I06_01295 [Candidatus Lindowbacteria bacterium RIFCSPLOWO2_02_FULL_62_12]
MAGGLAYTSDAKDRITGLSGLAGISVRYEYDPHGHVTKVVDGAGRVTAIEYDSKDREKKRTLPNGEVVEKEYNAAGWILKQTHRLGAQIFIRTWEYDPRGRAIGYVESPSPLGGEGRGEGRFTYAYDNSDRLIRATRPDGIDFQYTYDSRGNLTKITDNDEEITQTFDAADRLARREVVTFKKRKNKGHGNNEDHDDEDNLGKGKGKHGAKPDADDDGEDDDEIVKGKHGKRKIFEYVHDANGRAVAMRQVKKNGKSVKGMEITFTWDGNDRLIKSVKGRVSVDYTYDPQGRLVRRIEKDAGLVNDDRRFVWDVTSENILAEMDAGGNVLARYTPTRMQDDVIVKENLAARKTAIYSDFAANLPTKVVRDEFGNLLESLETIDPYGAMQTADSVDHTRFQGKMQDPVTGWYYFRHRFYDAQARRFVSKDPTPKQATDPSRINLYAAFGNNPVSNTDAMGLRHEIRNDERMEDIVTCDVFWKEMLGWRSYRDENLRKEESRRLRGNPRYRAYAHCLLDGDAGSEDGSAWDAFDFETNWHLLAGMASTLGSSGTLGGALAGIDILGFGSVGFPKLSMPLQFSKGVKISSKLLLARLRFFSFKHGIDLIVTGGDRTLEEQKIISGYYSKTPAEQSILDIKLPLNLHVLGRAADFRAINKFEGKDINPLGVARLASASGLFDQVGFEIPGGPKPHIHVGLGPLASWMYPRFSIDAIGKTYNYFPATYPLPPLFP